MSHLETLKTLIENRLDQLFPIKDELIEAARYAILGGGGKRLRPILTLVTANMFGANIHDALDPACALECIHTYSMIHDDLPCMDDDDYRRGRLTVHKQYSEGLAVLTGDFLLTYAFEIIAEAQNLDAEKKIKMVNNLAKHSGSEGMIGGQVMDLASEGKKISLEVLRQLHRQKTAALLTSAIEFGGIVGDAGLQDMEQLRLFGESMGLTFQIVDDILDVTQSEKKHGRVVSSDVVKGKSTYVSLLGLEEAKVYAQESYEQALGYLKALPYDVTMLVQLTDFVLKRSH